MLLLEMLILKIHLHQKDCQHHPPQPDFLKKIVDFPPHPNPSRSGLIDIGENQRHLIRFQK